MSQDSSVIIELVEIENFRSFRDRNEFGPLSWNFNAIIGPIASGKSNIVDAIRFVMGEETSALWVEDLDQLAHAGQQSTRIIPSVTAVLSIDNRSSRRKFTRIIVGPQQSEYKIDDLFVSIQNYTDSLQQLGINAVAKNFLISEGTVELIALKDPIELTEWFEEISGSRMLKDSYERQEKTVTRLENPIRELSSEKQALVAKVKEMMMRKEEAVEQRRELLEKKPRLQLFRLYRNELEIQSVDEDIANKKARFEEVDKKITTAREKSLKLKEKLESVELAYDVENDQILRLEDEVTAKRLSLMEAKEEVIFTEKKLSAAETFFEKAYLAKEDCCDVIRGLEQALIDVTAEKQSCKSWFATGSQVVQLGVDQVEEFQNLKLQAQIRSDEYFWKLDSMNCEQDADQDEFDFLTYQRADLAARIDGKTRRKEEMRERVEELAKRILTSENTLDEENRIYMELKDVVDSFKNRIPRLESDLYDVIEQLGEIQMDANHEARRREKLKSIEKCKILCPAGGSRVYDRVANVCHPTSDQYTIAINRLLEQYLDAIIVDSETTAKICVEHLRDHFLSPETFLPISSLRAEPLNKYLKKIREPEGVKLLSNVLEFDPAVNEIAPFLTNNVLICKTADDAEQAWEKVSERCRALIALDGTSFYQSGVISRVDPERGPRAPRVISDVTQLESSEEKIMDELHEMLKQVVRKEYEIAAVDARRQALTEHLREIKLDRELAMAQIQDLEEELREVTEMSEKIDSRLEGIRAQMHARDVEIQEMKERVNEVENDVFADFFRRHGLSMVDLRQYEEHCQDSSSFRERTRQRFELKAQKSILVDRLNFELQTKAMQNSDVQWWKCAVRDYEKELKFCKLTEEAEAREMEEYERQLDNLQADVAAKKAEVDSTRIDLDEVNNEVDQLEKEIPRLRGAAISWLEDEQKLNKWERYQIFKQSKVGGVDIPFLLGNVDEILDDFESTQTLDDRLSRVVVDYSSLASTLRTHSNDLEKVREKELKLAKTVEDLRASLEGVDDFGDDDIARLENEIKELEEKIESAQSRAGEEIATFEGIKEERKIKFQDCFDHVIREINNVYKALYQNDNVQVFLESKNSAEPYLDGINLKCATPERSTLLDFHHSSAQEQMMAALALLFTIHSYKPAPFLILDKVDDSLNYVNVNRLATYIRQQRNQLQTIVISDEEELYSQANYLIGLCSLKGEFTVSKIMPPINLDDYQ